MKTKFHFITMLIILFTPLLLTACIYSNGGFGDEVEEEWKVGDFDGIIVTSGVDINLSQGEVTRVIIRADEDIMDDVEVEVRGGRLEISVDRKWFRSGHVEADVTFRDIDLLDVNAGSDVEGRGLLRFDDLEIEASSGSDLELELEAREVSITASSGSDATLRGGCRDFIARASSGSDIDAFDFQVENARLDLSSGSDVKVWVTGSLEVDASSGSDVHYRGDPEVVNLNTSGGSDITKR